MIPLILAAALTTQVPARTFTFCHTGGGINCVVDGDTLWIDHIKIRISEIDAPETHQPKCASELARGRQSTEVLLAWVNAGAFELRRYGRDKDRNKRLLRTLERGGRSVGDMLIARGSARRWDGRRRGWC